MGRSAALGRMERLRSLVAVENPREVGLLTVAHGVNEFYSIALPPILPLLVSDFGVSYAQAGVLMTVYFGVYSVFQLPAGRLADRFGQRLLLAGGMVVLSAGVLLVAVAPTFPLVVLGQAIAGVGGSTYHPAGMSLISDVESGTTEGTAMGVHGFGGVAGTALAPALVGGLAVVFDWRLALTVAAGVGVVYTAAFLVLFEDVPKGERPAATPDGGGESVAIRDRLRTALNVPLEAWVVVLFVTNFALSLELNAVRTFATSYLFERTGEAALSNAVFFTMLVGAGVSSLGAGRLADVVDRAWLGVAAMGVSAVALALTVFIPATPALLLGWFLLVGAAMYAAYPAMNAIISARSEDEFSGSLFAIMLTAGSLGGAVGPGLFGFVVEAVGMGLAFPGIAAAGLVAALLFYLIRWV